MTRLSLIIATLFLCCISYSSSAQKNCTNCGVVKYSYLFYDSSVNEYMDGLTFYPVTMWYKDNFIVEQVTSNASIDDVYGYTTQSEIILQYTFVNLKSGNLYEYARFSPTAKLIKKSSLSDSMLLINGRATYAPEKAVEGVKINKTLPDTTMGGIVYKRVATYFVHPDLGTRYDFIEYFRCDLTTLLFDLDKAVSKKVGCPCVRIDIVPKREFSVSIRVDFISNTLTDEQSKAIDTWSKGPVPAIKTVDYNVKTPCKNCGTVVMKTSVWDSTTRRYKLLSEGWKAKFKDSTVMMPVKSGSSVEDGGEGQKDVYVYTDLKSLTTWHYDAFTTGATILQKNIDVEGSVGTNVIQYNVFNESLYDNKIESLPDTVIKGILYKRVKSESVNKSGRRKGMTDKYIGYMRCDKRIPFHFNYLFDKKAACPLVKLEYMTNSKGIWYMVEFEQTGTLSMEEQKVFSAWEQNAKEYPVVRLTESRVKSEDQDFDDGPGLKYNVDELKKLSN